MGRYVRISSEKSINVTAGLQCVNATNENSHNPESLNVRQLWSGLHVLIKKGVGYYPAIIQTWTTVKTLVDNEILTIGKECDSLENKEQEAVVEKECLRLEAALKKYRDTSKSFAKAKKSSVDSKTEE